MLLPFAFCLLPLDDLLNFGNFGNEFAQTAFNTHSQGHCRAWAGTTSTLQPQFDDRSINFNQFDVAAVCHEVRAQFVQHLGSVWLCFVSIVAERRGRMNAKSLVSRQQSSKLGTQNFTLHTSTSSLYPSSLTPQRV